MKFGLCLPSYAFPDLDYATCSRLRDFCVRAERLGYDAVWVPEHLLTARGLYGTAWLSPLEVLSFAAGATSRIKVATGILIPPIRNPVFLAKEIASLVYLSGGRFELGIGVGWDAHEFQVAGVPLGERGGRTDEILDVWAKLWAGQEVTHRGRYYAFERVAIDPPLPAPPRLWMAGGSKIQTSLSPDPPTISPTVLERIGRPRAALTFGHLNFTHVVATDREDVAHREQRPRLERVMGIHRGWEHLTRCYLMGTPARIRDRIAELAAAGLEYLLLSPLDYDLAQLDLWQEEIVRHFSS